MKISARVRYLWLPKNCGVKPNLRTWVTCQSGKLCVASCTMHVAHLWFFQLWPWLFLRFVVLKIDAPRRNCGNFKLISFHVLCAFSINFKFSRCRYLISWCMLLLAFHKSLRNYWLTLPLTLVCQRVTPYSFAFRSIEKEREKTEIRWQSNSIASNQIDLLSVGKTAIGKKVKRGRGGRLEPFFNKPRL